MKYTTNKAQAIGAHKYRQMIRLSILCSFLGPLLIGTLTWWGIHAPLNHSNLHGGRGFTLVLDKAIEFCGIKSRLIRAHQMIGGEIPRAITQAQPFDFDEDMILRHYHHSLLTHLSMVSFSHGSLVFYDLAQGVNHLTGTQIQALSSLSEHDTLTCDDPLVELREAWVS